MTRRSCGPVQRSKLHSGDFCPSSATFANSLAPLSWEALRSPSWSARALEQARPLAESLARTMAPFPTRRSTSSNNHQSLLPTAHYPPTSASSTPSNSRPPSPIQTRSHAPIHAASPRAAYGAVDYVGPGVSGGLGRTAQSEKVVKELLEVSD